MPKVVEGKLSAAGLKFGIVVSRFNHFVTDRLLEGGMDGLSRCGAREADIEVFKVPGTFEIPLTARKLAQSGRYDALVCLGAVIRGTSSTSPRRSPRESRPPRRNSACRSLSGF